MFYDRQEDIGDGPFVNGTPSHFGTLYNASLVVSMLKDLGVKVHALVGGQVTVHGLLSIVPVHGLLSIVHFLVSIFRAFGPCMPHSLCMASNSPFSRVYVSHHEPTHEFILVVYICFVIDSPKLSAHGNNARAPVVWRTQACLMHARLGLWVWRTQACLMHVRLWFGAHRPGQMAYHKAVWGPEHVANLRYESCPV